MLKSSLHVKLITRFFVLIYLLLSFSTAHASFWCLDEESSPHLESSPIGKCWTNCPGNTDAGRQSIVTTQAAVFLSEQVDDCLDSPAYTSAVTSSHRTNTPNRIFATDFDTVTLSSISAPGLEVTRFANLSRPADLPIPQKIKVLRTVILLH